MKLLASIRVASHHLDQLFAKDAFGLNRAAELARLDRNLHAGMSLVWTLIHARSREKFHDLDKMAKLFLAAAIGAGKMLEASHGEPRPRIPKFRRGGARKSAN
jgi:hypothetical protein